VLCLFVALLSSEAGLSALQGMQNQLSFSDTALPSSSRKTLHSHQPNIVFILTDDQDLHMSSLDHMPHLQKYLVKEGTTFTNHYCTVALCCPSRVSLWTGKHAHNTNVTDINPPHGRYCLLKKPCVIMKVLRTDCCRRIS